MSLQGRRYSALTLCLIPKLELPVSNNSPDNYIISIANSGRKSFPLLYKKIL